MLVRICAELSRSKKLRRKSWEWTFSIKNTAEQGPKETSVRSLTTLKPSQESYKCALSQILIKKKSTFANWFKMTETKREVITQSTLKRKSLLSTNCPSERSMLSLQITRISLQMTISRFSVATSIQPSWTSRRRKSAIEEQNLSIIASRSPSADHSRAAGKV